MIKQKFNIITILVLTFATVVAYEMESPRHLTTLRHLDKKPPKRITNQNEETSPEQPTKTSTVVHPESESTNSESGDASKDPKSEGKPEENAKKKSKGFLTKKKLIIAGGLTLFGGGILAVGPATSSGSAVPSELNLTSTMIDAVPPVSPPVNSATTTASTFFTGTPTNVMNPQQQSNVTAILAPAPEAKKKAPDATESHPPLELSPNLSMTAPSPLSSLPTAIPLPSAIPSTRPPTDTPPSIPPVNTPESPSSADTLPSPPVVTSTQPPTPPVSFRSLRSNLSALT